MKKIILCLLLVISFLCLTCKKDNPVTPSIWDLSGKIVFNPEAGNLSGIYVIDLNSSDLSLSVIAPNGDEPRVNSKGDEIVYTNSQPGAIDIFTVNLIGGVPVDLTPNPSLTDSWPDWSPDGSLIVFNRVFYPGFKEAICIMNKDGSNLHNLTDTSSLAIAVMPRWSPDGRRISFIGTTTRDALDGYNIYVIDPDGSNQVLLDYVGSKPTPSLPVWSPDSRTIAYAKTDAFFNLYLIDVITKSSSKITDSEISLTQQSVSWNPNGMFVCVGENVKDTSSYRYGVYLVSPKTLLIEKTLVNNFMPLPSTCSSPDGKHIAIFGITQTDAAFALYVVDVDGRNFRKLKDIDNTNAFIDDWQYCQWIN